MPTITSHARIRLRERCGKTSSDAQKLVDIAFRKGLKQTELDGRLRRYADALYLNYHNGNQIRLYGKHAFIFQNGKLITVLDIPERIIGDQFLKKRKEEGK